MDTSYLAQQVNSSISQLHGLFDEIGVPHHERDKRESEVSLILPLDGRRMYALTWHSLTVVLGTFRSAQQSSTDRNRGEEGNDR